MNAGGRHINRTALHRFFYIHPEPRALARQGHRSGTLPTSQIIKKNSMEGSDCLSVKIRISYNTSEELQGVIRLLHPVIKSCKVAKNKDGRYKKAYVELKCE